MQIAKTSFRVFAYVLVVLFLMGLVPFILNDYILAVIYVGFIALFVLLKKQNGDLVFITTGFLASFLGEYFFLSAGVEKFNRTSLLGIMPLWLPFLWSFIFLVMKRVFWLVFLHANSGIDRTK